MDILQSVIIAIVEGLTEFLPVSSTGHMIITQNILGVAQGDPFVHAYTFIIQFGAILSVVCLYWKHFFQVRNNAELKQKTRFYWLLDSVWGVAIMLFLGGVFMLFCDRIFNKGKEENKVNEKRALNIGLFQCISVIPGVSRSMATIVGGMSQGLTRKAAAEFSFFLAVPTMAGATLLDLIDMFKEDTTWATADNMVVLAVGCVVAFVVALLAMKWFVGFISKYGFKAFGWYRIVVGLVILVMLMSGVSLQMVD